MSSPPFETIAEKNRMAKKNRKLFFGMSKLIDYAHQRLAGCYSIETAISNIGLVIFAK